MKLAIILILFLIPIVSSLNVTLNYPEQIILGESTEFELKILNHTGELYDVKIDILGMDEKRVSRIYNVDGWKSTMYYVNSILTKKETFLLRIEDYLGNVSIVLKLRDKDGKILIFDGYYAKVIEMQNSSLEKIDELIEESAPTKVEIKKIKNPGKITSDTTKQDKILDEPKQIQKITPKIIQLNPKNFKNDNLILDSENKSYTKYSIFIFSVILLFLYIIKPKKKKNEWK